MPFLHGNLSLRKWRQRLTSTNGGKNEAKNATRGFSAPPDMEFGSLKTNGEYPIVKQHSEGLPVQSPMSFEHEVAKQEDVTMPEPFLSSAAVEMPVPIQMPVPDTLNSKEPSSSSSGSPEMPVNGHQGPQAPVPPVAMDLVDTLAATGVAARLQAGPPTKSEKSETAQVIKATVDMNTAMTAIESGLKSFMEDIPWLMKGLDEVARIHPVVTVAVLAFKAVYTMEMIRRENDKRIRSLYVEMKDMMAILVQLRDVRDPKERGPDGIPIDARLQGIAESTADDIKDCANTCDTYAKKRLVVKVLKGPVWETKLVGFVSTFTKRRGQFEEALAIHTARAVDRIEDSVYVLKTKLASMDEKLAVFNQIFQKFISSDEVKIAEKIKGNDIKSIQKNESLLRDLNDFENAIETRPGERNNKRSAFSAKDLRDELQEDFESAIVKNLENFEGKFVLYQRQLREELSKFIREENDRLLTAVKEGPHDRIKNEHIREIWKEMNWRRNVKAKLFVLTLRDHFRDDLHELQSPGEKVVTTTAEDIRATDDWAFEYLGLNWLQPIMEAFDEDGSGYVTVAEINRLTESLPAELNWSLQHWIAYWAVGWEISAQRYVNAIHQIFAAMFDLLPSLLPRNRFWADYYLDRVWPYAAELLFALRKRDLPDLDYKFRPYVEKEEERIRNNLKEIRYDIDALDTVHVVAGPGRIETHVLPMMYLLMQRDLQLFRLATMQQLDDNELWDCADSHIWIQRAVEFRVEDLANRFKQQQLDVPGQFKMVACEMLHYYHDGIDCWDLSKLQTLPFSDLNSFTNKSDWYSEVLRLSEPPSDDVDKKAADMNKDPAADDNASIHSGSTKSYWMTPMPSERAMKRLKRHLIYPLNEKAEYDVLSYDEPAEFVKTEADLSAPGPLLELIGQWNGYTYTDSEFPVTTMWQFNIHASPPEAVATSPVAENEEALDSEPHDEEIPLGEEDNVADRRSDRSTSNDPEGNTGSAPLLDDNKGDELQDASSPEWIARHSNPQSLSPTLSQLPPLPPSRSTSLLSSSTSSISLSQLPPLPPSRSTSSNRSRSRTPSPARTAPSPEPSLASSGPRFEAVTRDFDGAPISMSGRCYTDEDGVVRVNFVISFVNTTYSDEHWSGHIDESGSLVGYKAWWSRPTAGDNEQMFILRRTSSALMALRPSPSEFLDNKPRALWQFAIGATIHQLRKESWSWSFFKARRDHRLRYLTLNLRNWTYGRRPEGEEYAEFLGTRKAIYPEHANLIRSMRDHMTGTLPKHCDLTCSSCKQTLGGQRIMCLDCRPEKKQLRLTVNFCDHLVCGEKKITSEQLPDLSPKRPHRPTHDFVKLRSVLHLKDMPAMDREAHRALQRCRQLIEDLQPSLRPASVETVVDGEVLIEARPEPQVVPSSDPPSVVLPGTIVNEHVENTEKTSDADLQPGVETGLPSKHLAPDAVAQLDLLEANNEDVDLPLDVPALDAPPPDQTIVEEELPELPTVPSGIVCYTCRKAIKLPCWFCVSCQADVFLCDDCESNHLLPCRCCGVPYTQPYLDWFYGERTGDLCLCQVCKLKGTVMWYGGQHMFTHPLVRCKERIEDPEEPAPPTTDERLASLENRVGAIDDKLDRLQSQLETMFMRMEQRLLSSLTPLPDVPSEKKKNVQS
ncbi:hypothetical protein EIP91_006288 [Steccherinum ochraceum]|uniref:EF-hand domain-containing protein n=1 Tax=Steccherinum ochraceum TaxID=92696 RepID=A0A4R0RRC4_9APHY|nr:hypothetical protein EIP91_006288 [Steccherinum ochraceum]